MSVQKFYAPARQTRGFGYFGGSTYTIAPGFHIGMDVLGGEVPAMVGGTVVRCERSDAMSWGVVLDTGMPGKRRYHSYWHLAHDRLPARGTWVPAGGRVGRTARGPRSLAKTNPEWPGNAWLGEHCHVVVAGHPDSAHNLIPGHRSLDSFTDPRLILDEVSAAPAMGGNGPTPFVPKEWDEMATKDEVKAAVREVLGEVRPGPVSVVPGTDGTIYLMSLVSGKRMRIGSPYHVSLIQRVVRNDGADKMLPAEMNIVSGYLSGVNPPVGASVDVDALAARLGKIAPGASAAQVKSAVEEALRETVGKIRLEL